MTPNASLMEALRVEESPIQMPAAPKSLVSKLADIMAAVERIAKRGHNDHFNYDFATESDITATIRKELAARSLMLVPHVESLSWREVPTRAAVNAVCCAMVKFTIHDGETGAMLEFVIPGEGQDGGDKCVPKALTSAVKYALLKLFLIPTGDDPERSDGPKAVPARRAPAKPERPAGVPVTAAAPSTVNPDTGEELPPGYHYIDSYTFRAPWHEITVLNWDAQGGAVTLSSKFKAGEDAKKAFQDHVAVKLDITPKKNGKGEGYLNHVYRLDDPAADDSIPF